jgi:hypothetical protein
MAFRCYRIEFLLQLDPRTTGAGMEKRDMLAYGSVGLIPVNAGRSRIPRGKTSLSIQSEERVSLHP